MINTASFIVIYFDWIAVVAVPKLLLMLTCTLPLFLLLRTTSRARPFHVVTRGEVDGSRSFMSADAKAMSCP